MSELNTKNLQYIDTLRALAIVGVVFVHVATPALNMNFHKNVDFWLVGLVYDSLVRYAVPIFLIISGVTMLGRKYDLTEFYKKRFSRVLIPFLFWLPAYWVFRWFMLFPYEQPNEFTNILKWAGSQYIKDGVSVHLWFVYMILFLYLFLPFISNFVLKTNKKTLLLILVSWLFINTLQSLKIFNIDSFPFLLKKIYGYTLYGGYLILGYYLKIQDLNITRLKLYSCIVFVITLIIAVIPTYFFNLDNNRQNLMILGTFTFNTVLQSIAVFYFVKSISVVGKYKLLIINTISSYSFGIYLVHVMVLSVFFRQGIYWKLAHSIFSIPFVVFLTLITSMFIIFIMKKIPGFKIIAG